MSEFTDFDLDRSVSRAWKGFQARLADYLVGMTDDDSLVINVVAGEEPEEGASPYVQFAGFGEDHLRGEVSGNGCLSEEHQLDPGRVEALGRQGWAEPDDSLNHSVDVLTSDGDRLAVMAVRALRDVFDVPHPAFLSTFDEDDAERLGLTGAPVEGEPEDDEPLAIVPESAEHLQQLVDEALTPVFGHVPVKDEDGDIPVPYNSTLVFVRVYQDEPLIDIFGAVVTDVTDLEAARIEAQILNRDVKFIKFVVSGDHVLAQLQIPSYPFVPQVLRHMLHFMSSALDEIDDDLALRTGGRLAIDAAPAEEDPAEEDPAEEDDDVDGEAPPQQADGRDDSRLHPVLRRMSDIDPAGDVLAPDDVADLCDHERDVVAELLRQSAKEEIACTRALESAVLAGDEEQAEAQEGDLHAWEATTRLLRRTLLLVVRADRWRRP